MITTIVIVAFIIGVAYVTHLAYNAVVDNAINVGEIYRLDSKDPFQDTIYIYVIEKKGEYIKYVYIDGPDVEVNDSFLEKKNKWSSRSATIYEISKKVHK